MEIETISRIPETIFRRGARYNLLKRGVKTLMYERVSNGITISIEVFQIKIRKSVEVKGQYIQASERFPHDEAFGNWAKCLKTLKMANKRFDEYENRTQ